MSSFEPGQDRKIAALRTSKTCHEILSGIFSHHLLCMKKEFTASTYIFDDAKVLLVFHKKLKKWLPVGGHVELNETPEEAAKREAKEESGIDIEFIPQENISVRHPNAQSIARPYLCLLEEVPSFGTQPHHQHIDFVFIAKPKEGSNQEIAEEVVRWFTLQEICTLSSEELFLETKEILEHLFKEMF